VLDLKSTIGFVTILTDPIGTFAFELGLTLYLIVKVVFAGDIPSFSLFII